MFSVWHVLYYIVVVVAAVVREKIFLRIRMELSSNVILKRPTMEFHYCAKLYIKNIPLIYEREKGEYLSRWKRLLLELIYNRRISPQALGISVAMNSSHLLFYSLHRKIPVCVKVCVCLPRTIQICIAYSKMIVEVYSKRIHFCSVLLGMWLKSRYFEERIRFKFK